MIMRCITLYGIDHLQEKRQQALLLCRRECPRPGQTAHCRTNLLRDGRTGCGVVERSYGSSAGRSGSTGIRPPRSTVGGGSAFRRMGRLEIDMGAAGIGTIDSSLSAVGGDPSHLSTWTEDGSRRL